MAILRVLARFGVPIGLVAWILVAVSREGGTFAGAMVSLALGAALGLAWGLRRGLGGYPSYRMARFGAFLGFVGFVPIACLLNGLGFEDDTGPGKAHRAALAEVEGAMRRAARVPDPDRPYDRLAPEVERAMGGLPDHPMDRPTSVDALIAHLDDPDPAIRAQVALALGRFEGMATRILPLLEARLGSPEPRTRAAAAVALTGMRPWTPSLRDRLLPMLADPDDRVELAAVAAVRKVLPFLGADRSSVDRLREAAAAAHPAAKRELEAILARLAPPG